MAFARSAVPILIALPLWACATAPPPKPVPVAGYLGKARAEALAADVAAAAALRLARRSRRRRGGARRPGAAGLAPLAAGPGGCGAGSGLRARPVRLCGGRPAAGRQAAGAGSPVRARADRRRRSLDRRQGALRLPAKALPRPEPATLHRPGARRRQGLGLSRRPPGGCGGLGAHPVGARAGPGGRDPSQGARDRPEPPRLRPAIPERRRRRRSVGERSVPGHARRARLPGGPGSRRAPRSLRRARLGRRIRHARRSGTRRPEVRRSFSSPCSAWGAGPRSGGGVPQTSARPRSDRAERSLTLHHFMVPLPAKRGGEVRPCSPWRATRWPGSSRSRT